MSADNLNRDAGIKQQVEEIISAGALGKSEAFARLLRYLAEKSKTGKSVKEIEIAIDVFGRDETFDVGQDSLVRVYIHKLRTKLNQFYANTDNTYSKRLSIPKGSYLLSLIDNEEIAKSPSLIAKIANPERIVFICTGLVIGIAISLSGFFLQQQNQLSDNPLYSDTWSALAEQSTPLLVVLGDLFVFSEVTSEFEQLREIHDFSIHNAREFSQRQQVDPEFSNLYRDFGVRYFPESTASSVKSLSEFLGSEYDWEFRLASDLSEQDLQEFNILYIGFYASLNRLEQVAFAGSSLQLHPNGNVLINSDNGEVFVGEGQLAEDYRGRYLDYALLRKTHLPNGNAIFALMSSRDAGLNELAKFVFSKQGTEQIDAQLNNPEQAFELLLEVAGNGPKDLISQIRMIQLKDE